MVFTNSEDERRWTSDVATDLHQAYVTLLDLAIDPVADMDLRCTLGALDLQECLADLLAHDHCPLDATAWEVLPEAGASATRGRLRTVEDLLDGIVGSLSGAVLHPDAATDELLTLARVLHAVSRARRRLGAAAA